MFFIDPPTDNPFVPKGNFEPVGSFQSAFNLPDMNVPKMPEIESLYPGKTPRKTSTGARMEALNFMNFVNPIIGGLSNQYNLNRGYNEMLKRTASPYSGLLPFVDGMSEGVKYGYETYQDGGPVGDIDTLIDKEIENELSYVEPSFGVQQEPDTPEDTNNYSFYDQAQDLLKKAQGRAIVESYRGRPQADAQDDEYVSGFPYQPSDRANKAYEHYVSQGVQPHIAAGIVGNLIAESNLNPNAVGDGGAARGIAQWHPNRYNSLVSYAKSRGQSPDDFYTQLNFVLEEPEESKKVMQALSRTATPEQAARVFSDVYERPARFSRRRARNARYIQDKNK